MATNCAIGTDLPHSLLPHVIHNISMYDIATIFRPGTNMADHQKEIEEFGNNNDFWLFGYGYQIKSKDIPNRI